MSMRVQQSSDSKIPVELENDPVMVREEIKILREHIAMLELRVQDAQIDRDEWKEKAKKLAGNFIGALKDLKESLYSVKRD